MDGNDKVFRRIIHSIVCLVLLYYLVPDPLFGQPKRLLLLVLLAIVLAFEALRLYCDFQLPTMRFYEKEQLASYAWASTAAAITLVFFPKYLAFVVFLGMGLVDPMIGEMQVHLPKFYPYIPLISWISLASIILILMTTYSLPFVIFLSFIGGIVAIVAEYPCMMIDDDFLMVVAPLFVLRGLEVILI